MTNAVSLAQQASNGVSPGFRNRIINGSMVIDQRNAGASVTVNGAAPYTLDRWRAQDLTDGVFTVQQDAGAVTPPAGFTDYLGVTTTTADSSLGASQVARVFQSIEGFNVADLGWGTANAKTVTLSFWVRSSLTGSFGGSLLNGSDNRAYPFSYTISSANTWEQKSVTIPGDTTGTWNTTNGTGIVLIFGLGVGSTFSGTAGAWAGSELYAPTGSVSVIGTLNATWYITGVQLEVGSTATSFDYRPYGTELQLCQRYYQEYNAAESAAAGGGSTGVCGNSALAVMSGFLPVEMRTTPSFGFNNIVINFGGGTAAVTSVAGFYSGRKALGFDLNVSGTPLTTGRAAVLQFSGGQSAANKWFLSAEL